MISRNDIINEIREATGLSKSAVKEVVFALEQTIVSHLAAGEDVRLNDLGTFKVTERAARKGVNPRTGEAMEIPASKAPKMKFAAPVLRAVKGD